MFKQLSKLAVGLTLLFGAAASQAALISWHDSYETKQYLNYYNTQSSWTFDITDDGFTPGSDWVQQYKIKLYLGDDRDPWYRPFEYAFFNQPGFVGDRLFEVDPGSFTVGWSIAGLISLNYDGTLSVSLTRTKGDFYFYGADLWAYGKSHAVPEPGTLGIMLAGLLGLGIARRLRRA